MRTFQKLHRIHVFSQAFSSAVVMNWFVCSKHGILGAVNMEQCQSVVRTPVSPVAIPGVRAWI